MVRLSGVGVSYDGMDVLRDVDLEVREGDFMAITGPNGGGKTTLLRVMLKLLKPTQGTVEYYSQGRVTKDLAVGYLPQKTAIDRRFPISVEQMVMSGLLKGFGLKRGKDDERRFMNAVDLCGISEILRRPVGTLSGGQLQRALLARAIVDKPSLLVLDEPLSYVDKNFERKIYSIMEEIARTTTIVLVSHEMSIISSMANRHIIVDHGLHVCNALNHYVPGDCCENG